MEDFHAEQRLRLERTIAEYNRIVELFTDGTMRMYGSSGGGLIDTTEDELAYYKAKISELQKYLKAIS